MILKGILFFSLFFISCKSYACNCLPGGSIQKNVINSDVIIRARIITVFYSNKLDTLGAKIIGDPRNTFARYWSFNVKIYKALIIKTYKGYLSADTVNIVTGMNKAACGIDFTIGGDYLIYGFEKDYMGFSGVQRIATNNKMFWTNTCTRSWYFSDEEEKDLLAELEKY